MIFNPDKGALWCPSCQSEKAISSEGKYKKHSYVAGQHTEEDSQQWAQEIKAMKCPNCGAHVILQDYTVSGSCPYCSTGLVAETDKLIALKPDSVVPFKFGKEKAETIFKSKINRKWFVPKKFKKMVKAESIQAYYFPSFVYDADCVSAYDGRLYREHTRTDSEGKKHTTRSYFHIKGEEITNHRNVEIETSTKLEQRELKWVRPYDFSQAKEYTNEYISGYALECYSNSVDESYAVAESSMKDEIKRTILRHYNYDGVSYLNIDSKFSNQKYTYCVLPMYRINYNYKGKMYSNVINGQTGTMGGRVPKSGLKIAMCILLPILLLTLPVALFMLLLI